MTDTKDEVRTWKVGDRVQFTEDSFHVGRHGTVTAVDPETGKVSVRHWEYEAEHDKVDPAELEPDDSGTFDMDDVAQLVAELRSSVAHSGDHTGLDASPRLERIRAASRIAHLATRVAWLLTADEWSEQERAKRETTRAKPTT